MDRKSIVNFIGLAGILIIGSAGCEGEDRGCVQGCDKVRESKCENGQIQTCEINQAGCLDWSLPEACDSGQCKDETNCSPSCNNLCIEEGASLCSAGKISTCQKAANGCLDWSEETVCESGKCLDETHCVAVCKEQCPGDGVSECYDGRIRTCRKDEQECLQWTAYKACETGTCEGSTKCSGCEEECTAVGQGKCIAGTISYCTTNDYGCLVWGTSAPCQSGDCADESTCLDCENTCEKAGDTRCQEQLVQTCTPDAHGCLDWSTPEECPQGSCDPSTNTCVCQKQCQGRNCGPDGCGGDCGECDDSWTCNPTSGQCVQDCIPDCQDRKCGLDPVCGTLTCGLCGNNETCTEEGTCFCPSEMCEGSCCPANQRCVLGACCQDNDNDDSCAELDCDDEEPLAYPGATEDCDDLVDNDCDTRTDMGDDDCASSSVCGNGKIEDQEKCDDNNKSDNDGCSSQCQLEVGWFCSGEPSTCGSTAQEGEVVITEIMKNPKCVDDSDGEWIEITNTTDRTLQLRDWEISDDDTDSTRLSTFLLGGHQIAVVCRNGLSAENGNIPCDLTAALILANAADEVNLKDGAGHLIDRVAYDDGLTFPDPNGASMSFPPNADDNNLGENWCTGTKAISSNCATPDRGSPGELNTACCTPECINRECGPDPVCGASCGNCVGGEVCSIDGHCQPAAPGDTCATPLMLSGNQGVIDSTTVGANADYVDKCGGLGPEVVYAFEVTQTTRAEFLMSGYDTVLYIRTTCTQEATTIACNDDSPNSANALLQVELWPGTYYLFADSSEGTSPGGAYLLTYNLRQDPCNSNPCPDPKECEANADWSGYECYCPEGTLPWENGCLDDPCNPQNPCTQENKHVCVPDLDSQPPYSCQCDPGTIPDPQNPSACIPSTNPDGTSCSKAIPLSGSEGNVTGSTASTTSHGEGSCAGDGPDLIYTFSLDVSKRATFDMSGYDTALHLRSICNDPSSELACDDDGGSNYGSLLSYNLLPGVYFLFADSYYEGGDFTLSYTFASNPCLSNPCPSSMTCEPNGDWSGYECVCPQGTLPYNGDCVDDPCVNPNPCTEPHKSQCEPLLGSQPPYACSCDPGYMPDPAQPGACIPDPLFQGDTCDDPVVLPETEGVLSASTVGLASDDKGECGGNGPDRIYTFQVSTATRADFLMSGYDTVLHLRTSCEDPATEIACDDESGGNNAAHFVSYLEPGIYFLYADSYSDEGGQYDLTYSLRPDPCTSDPCPGTPECQANSDWTDYRCVCPAGMVPYEGDCIKDPCDPNPCTQIEHKTKCVANLPVDYDCFCAIGYLDDGQGGCTLDPNANEWAIYVFLNADNNLSSFGEEDVAEMMQVGSTPYVHIVALFDTYESEGRIIHIKNGSYDIIENWGEVNMSDPQTLADFGIWAAEHFPARHHMLVLWDHGEGWRLPDKDTGPIKAFSNDDHPGGGDISVAEGEYAWALGKITQAVGGKLDVVGFDACLMGMWEVAVASEPYAEILVASQETEPGAGWPYNIFLGPLVDNPQMTASELATTLVNAYYNASSDNSTMAASNLSQVALLNARITELANQLTGSPASFSELESLRTATQQFYYIDDYRDLGDFSKRVKDSSTLPSAIKTAAQALYDQLKATVILSMAQSSHPDATGLTIYFPSLSAEVESQYLNTVWSTATTWDEFLNAFSN